MASFPSFLHLSALALLTFSSLPCAKSYRNVSLGSSLTTSDPNTYWLSPSGEFAFGFRPLETDSSSFLLAVWFEKIESKTVAWYPRPYKPVTAGSSVELTTDGQLLLKDRSGSSLWDPGVSNAAYAALLDTGNFILAGANGSPLWQTFQNPADTMLPSQVLEMDSKLLFQYDAYWSTDSAGNGTGLFFNQSGIRATLDFDGVFRQYIYPKNGSGNGAWTYCTTSENSSVVCECPPQYSFLDPSRRYKGCKPEFPTQSCDADESEAASLYGFRTLVDVDWPLSDYEEYSPISEDQCREECLTDCFCALAVFHADSGTCWKKKIPLSNGKKASDVNRRGFLLPTLSLRSFTYPELEEATNSFREELGSGASGVNLVRLVGFCCQGADRLLVYEFMSNGSLMALLSGEVRPSWDQRVQIALGIARGLLYLHEECISQIIHCDIKPQNVLLDDNLVPRIADFGLAKLLKTDQTRTKTDIRGTKGYVAPEWFKNAGVTAKVDVYSFGVMLLEIANDRFRDGRLDLLVEGDEEATLDMRRVDRFVRVALWCIQEEPSMRPTMHKVAQMLDGTVAVPIPPDPSSYISSLLE
ncbi:receptor-like protein kinase [Musa troglodytarum]|uniref:non-specific serine/threonine protein kinase n=1 Tax=Musa troglodytarum TaxID=320322 RepID=A0A9E7KQD5_9LILI|nr:receptor-like protein kinase [Musa troglodytarum]